MSFMKNTVQQEILLMTNSSLSNTNLCEKNSLESGKQFSNVERLEQACWNGMLDEFLPGLVVKAEGKTLFLWEIQTAKNFLHIDLSDEPVSFEKESSIDPYYFVDLLVYN
jgi:hypothetical protein